MLYRPGWPGSYRDPPASPSQSAGIKGVHHGAQLLSCFVIHWGRVAYLGTDGALLTEARATSRWLRHWGKWLAPLPKAAFWCQVSPVGTGPHEPLSHPWWNADGQNGIVKATSSHNFLPLSPFSSLWQYEVWTQDITCARQGLDHCATSLTSEACDIKDASHGFGCSEGHFPCPEDSFCPVLSFCSSPKLDVSAQYMLWSPVTATSFQFLKSPCLFGYLPFPGWWLPF